MKKHHIEIAKEKLKKKQDITVCTILNSGVIYQGGFYSDCNLEDYESQNAFCVEADGWLHLFMPNGKFATSIIIDKVLARKEYRKTLNRILK